jgi:hypothetical protein
MQQMVLYCRTYCSLNMFRPPLCPSSGAQEYYTGPVCGHITYSSTPDRQPVNQAPSTTGSNYLYNTLKLLMMGIMVPETCWVSNKFCNKEPSVASSWPFYFHGERLYWKPRYTTDCRAWEGEEENAEYEEEKEAGKLKIRFQLPALEICAPLLAKTCSDSTVCSREASLFCYTGDEVIKELCGRVINWPYRRMWICACKA